MKGLTFAGYLDDKPVYYGRTEGVLYDEEGIPASEVGLDEGFTDPLFMIPALLNARGYAKGSEFPIPFGGRNDRFAPWGNRAGNKFGKWPHYHRSKPDPKRPGHSLPEQSHKRHRPWEKRDGDKSWKDRL